MGNWIWIDVNVMLVIKVLPKCATVVFPLDYLESGAVTNQSKLGGYLSSQYDRRVHHVHEARTNVDQILAR